MGFLKGFRLPLVLGLLAVVTAAHGVDWLSRADPLTREWVRDMNEDKRRAPGTYAPIVTIKNGTIEGTTALSVGGKTMYEYLGIPFAAAPVGDLRFEPPQPHGGWGDETLIATKQPHACPQHLTNLTIADEDCLFLSVYSRRDPATDGPLLPVVFFIHGGGFQLGQASGYTGVKLLNNEEIVLVSVQYRLGPLGFLSTGDNYVSANNGMKDQVQGLRWVQENIAAFGGDPNQVTVMGESAGSSSALYMLISPLARGLYHGIIAMSGSPMQEWGLDRDPVRTTKRLGTMLNCTTDTMPEIVSCLKEMKWGNISQAALGINIEDFLNYEIRINGASPTIEGDIPGAFLPDDPIKLITEGDIPDVPVLLGTVQHEGVLPLAAVHYLTLNPMGLLNDTVFMREQFLGKLLTTWGVDETINGASVSQTMALGYLKPGQDKANFEEYQYQLMNMLTALFMKAPILRTAEILSRRISSVYLYNFERYNEFGSSLYNWVFTIVVPIIGGEKPPFKHGICHADDLMYMFRLPFILSPNDTIFSRTYTQLFINFIVHGNPTPVAGEDYPIWPKYDPVGQNYLVFKRFPFEVKQDFTGNWRLGMKGEDGYEG